MLTKYYTTIAKLLLTSTVLLSFATHAQDNAQTSSDTGVSEQTLRELFQDLKNYLGLKALKDVETQNVLRLTLPPLIDQTMAVNARIDAADQAMPTWQDKLVRDTANYNMNTPKEASTDTEFLSLMKEEFGGNAMVNPEIGLDPLLASSLLTGLAFEDDNAAQNSYEFIRRLTNPTPIAAMSAEEIFTDYPDNENLSEKGGQHLMQLYKQLPSMTLAQNSLLAIHAEKQRFKEFAKGLDIGDPDTNSASLMEVMDFEVKRRMSPEWHNEMNQMSTEALLKEIANIMAFQNYVMFKNYEREQRMEALMASQISVMSSVFNSMSPSSMDVEEFTAGFE